MARNGFNLIGREHLHCPTEDRALCQASHSHKSFTPVNRDETRRQIPVAARGLATASMTAWMPLCVDWRCESSQTTANLGTE